jgi:hypothetical protein
VTKVRQTLQIQRFVGFFCCSGVRVKSQQNAKFGQSSVAKS